VYPQPFFTGPIIPGFHPGEPSVVPAGLAGAVRSYPGLRPGLLSAVPAGLSLLPRFLRRLFSSRLGHGYQNGEGKSSPGQIALQLFDILEESGVEADGLCADYVSFQVVDE
jgi:hypothetical protein